MSDRLRDILIEIGKCVADIEGETAEEIESLVNEGLSASPASEASSDHERGFREGWDEAMATVQRLLKSTVRR